MSNKQPKKPAYVAKTREANGNQFTYQRVGVGFQNEDGSVFVQLYGTQLIGSFMLYPIPEGQQDSEA